MDLLIDEGPQREEQIFQEIVSGNYSIDWSEVTSTYKNHSATFAVFSDALRINNVSIYQKDSKGNPSLIKTIDGLRVNLNAKYEQMVADHFGCSLLTPKLADLIWQQAQIKIKPSPQTISSSSSAMLAHSERVNSQIYSLPRTYIPVDQSSSLFSGILFGQFSELICTVGKHWVIDNVLYGLSSTKAANYGWHFEGSSFQGIIGEACASLMKDKNGMFVRVIQGVGTAHDWSHTDYSQTIVLVKNECFVDGVQMKIQDVMASDELAPLISAQGKMKLFRQPGV